MADEAIQELYSFFRALEQDKHLKELYFNSDNREERRQIIERQGFDSALILNAVNNIEINIDDRNTTIKDWLDSKNVDRSKTSPVRIILSAIQQIDTSNSLAQITSSYQQYNSSLESQAGGAGKPYKMPEAKESGYAKNVESEVSGDVDNPGDVTKDINEIRSAYDDVQNAGELESKAKDIESGFDQVSEQNVDKTVNEFRKDIYNDAERELDLQARNIENDLKDKASNALYNQLTSDAKVLQDELGGNASVTVQKEADGYSLDIEKSASGSLESGGSTTVTDGATIDATLNITANDLEGPAELNIKGTVSVDGNVNADETNSKGSITGDAKFTDAGSVDMTIDPLNSTDDSVKTTTSGPKIDLTATVDEAEKESYNSKNVTLDGTTTIKGNIEEQIDVDVRDPSDTTVKNVGNDLDINQSLKASADIKATVGDLELSTNLKGSIDANLDVSSSGAKPSITLGEISADVGVSDDKPIDLGTYDAGEDEVTVYAKPSGSLDLDIDPNDQSVTVTDASVNPNISVDAVPS
ncbi:Nif11-like leader peptide family natural product precursor [Prochlorococcus sp. MIT 1306]|uniref:Nif11-like leader peptide family natural product precursor n=1 Tax=Prochlorococcus sp. MIT 1306 TaxID=1799667 RepID=UPI0007B36067|nr:Nif11-like leader peptide family natural product precursor [Prochlorococcus sp. MIT 1306]KZR65037.1 hypothetical protein PMIT1306_00718 [Prochlorococcus sp. MIT 1306]